MYIHLKLPNMCNNYSSDVSQCIGFTWQGFGRGGSAGVNSVRCQKLLQCWTKPVPAGSKMDPLLAKAESINDVGSTALIYLRKSRRVAQQQLVEREEIICETNNSADTKVSKEGGGRGVPGTGAEISLQPVVKTMVTQVVPLQSMEAHGGADVHTAACGGHPTGAGGRALNESAACGALQAGAGFWQELQPMERSPLRSRFSASTCDPVGDPTLEQSVPEGLHPMERTMLEKFLKNTAAHGKGLHWRSSLRHHTGAEEEWEEE